MQYACMHFPDLRLDFLLIMICFSLSLTFFVSLSLSLSLSLVWRWCYERAPLSSKNSFCFLYSLLFLFPNGFKLISSCFLFVLFF